MTFLGESLSLRILAPNSSEIYDSFLGTGQTPKPTSSCEFESVTIGTENGRGESPVGCLVM